MRCQSIIDIMDRFLDGKEEYRKQKADLEELKRKLRTPPVFDPVTPRVQHSPEASPPELYVSIVGEREERLQETRRRLQGVLKATKLLIHGVPDKKAREALAMRHLRGKTWPECAIAAGDGSTEKAIKTRVFRNGYPVIGEYIESMKLLLHEQQKNG